MMRDHYNSNNSTFFLKTKCYICKKTDHFAKFCPKLHFIPDKEKVLLKKMYFHKGNLENNN